MKRLIIIFFILASLGGYAQQDPVFTQYVFNDLAINPAYAGTSEALSVDLVNRFQWVGVKNSPKTTIFSANTNLPNPHLGVGLFVFRDALGPTVESGLMGSFSYKILFPQSKLSFGLQFGFDYLNIDWNSLNPEDNRDPLLSNQVRNRAVPDAGIGMYYSTKTWYAGISSTHLMQSRIVVSKTEFEDNSSFSKLMRHFYVTGGVVIPVSDDLVFRPTALIKYVPNAPLQADVNMSLLIHQVLWIGIGYRTENCVNLMAEVNIMKNIHIGYSYDAWFNPLVSYNSGSHEIRLGIDFDLFKTGKMIQPRYF